MRNKNYLIYYTIILIIFAIVSSLINNLMLWVLFAIYIPVGFLTSLAIGSESNDFKIETSTPNYSNKTQINKEKEINDPKKQKDIESNKIKKPNIHDSNAINDVTIFQSQNLKKVEEAKKEQECLKKIKEKNYSLNILNAYVNDSDYCKMLLFEYDLSDDDLKEIINIMKSQIESGDSLKYGVMEELANRSRFKQQENFQRLFDEQNESSKITLLEEEPDIKDFYIEFTYFDHDKIYYEDPENKYFRFDLSKNIESICDANRIKKNLKVKNKYYNMNEWDCTPLEKLEPFSKEEMNLLFQHLYKKILNKNLKYREDACSHLDSLTGLSYKRTDYFKTLLK